MAFPRNLFYYYYYFLEILFNDLELVFLELKHFYKTYRTRLFYFYLFIFYSFLVIILFIYALHLLVLFPLPVNTQYESVLFLLVVSHCILMLSTFCTFRITSSKKKTKHFNKSLTLFVKLQQRIIVNNT